MLFLELALIRLVAAHNVYVRYFTNFVLLASFLGIGLGFLRANSKRDSFRSLPYFLLLTIAFVMLFPVGQRNGATHGAFGWPSLPVWLSLPLIFTLVTLVMMASAAGVARAFATFRPLHAYRLDIVGSILGIILFTIASILRLPPVAWVLADRPPVRSDARPARDDQAIGWHSGWRPRCSACSGRSPATSGLRTTGWTSKHANLTEERRSS